VEEQGQTPVEKHAAIGVATDAVATMKCRACQASIDTAGQAPFESVTCASCGAGNTVPARLGQFLLLDLLGTGGMGGVYYARDEALGRDVVIKVMLKSLGDDPKFIETFKREAQAVARLNHTHIAQIYSFGQEKGQPYIVMELVNGQRLDQMIESGEPLSQSLVMRIGLEIAQGLSAADEAGLVHGDIKPENILLDPKGQAKLVDFGLAVAKHQTDEDGIWGTPYYIAPERVRRQSVDARADIYSLGATLYHALTGHPPFEGDTPIAVVKARLTEPPAPLRSHREDLDEDVERIVLRMLEADFARRYPTYNSLLSDMKRVMEKIGADSAPVARRGKSIRLARKGSGSMTAPVPVKDSGGGKSRIVIRKGGGGPAVPTSGSFNKATSTQPVLEAAEQAELAAQRRETRRRQWRRVLVTAGVLLALGAIGGTVGWWSYRRSQRLERRRELFRYHEKYEAASNQYRVVSATVEAIQQLAAAATARLDVLDDHVEAVTGAPFERPPRPGLAVEAPDDAADPDADAVADDTAEAPDDADAEVTVEAPDDPDDEMPANDAPGPDDEAVVDAPEPVTYPPIVEDARAAAQGIYRLEVFSADALDWGVKADTVDEQVRTARRSAQLRPLTNELARIAATIDALRGQAESESQAVGRLARAVEEKRRAHDESVAAARRREREETEQRQIELDRRREEEERQRRIDQELGEVGAVTNTVRVLHREHAYGKAIEEIEAKLATLETAEGREAMQVVMDRYRMLQGLQAFLIARINEHPFEWGWVQEGSRRDILGAGADGIRVRGRAEPVPWSMVAPWQMLQIIEHYLAHSGTRASVRMVQTMATAIYCFETGGERGLELARRYFDQALNLRYPQPEAMRLLPLGW